ncbi:MAG: 3-oxoacyl-ACP synthase, partial [Acidimicrobiales bacterium]
MTDGSTTSDLAGAAARRALDDAGLVPSDIGLVVVATSTPDQPLPSTASLVARDLGLRCPSFDLTAANAGWVYSLVTAAAMVHASGGPPAHVVAADVLDRLVHPPGRTPAPRFADGAAAVV